MIDIINAITLAIDFAAELARLTLYVAGTWMCIKWIMNN